MLATFVIGLREGLEAALIVGIIAAFLKSNGSRADLRKMWAGVGAAILLCIAVGIGLEFVTDGLPQRQQEMLECVIAAIAVIIVSFMVLWMKKHSHGLKADLEDATASALARGSAMAMVAMALLAVLREGFETAVFLVAAFQSSTSSSLAVVGAFCGIIVALFLGWLIYRGGVRFNMSRFFRATGVVLVLVAAGLVVKTFRAAHEAGWLDVGQQRALDFSGFIRPGSVTESLVTGVLGIQARPVVVEVIAYLLYAVPMLLVVLWPPNRPLSDLRLRHARYAVATIAIAGAGISFVLAPSATTTGTTTIPVSGAADAVTVTIDAVHPRTVAVRLNDGSEWTLHATDESTIGGVGVTTYEASKAADALTTLANSLTGAEIKDLRGGRYPVGMSAIDADAQFAPTYKTQRTVSLTLDPRTGVVSGFSDTTGSSAIVHSATGSTINVGVVADRTSSAAKTFTASAANRLADASDALSLREIGRSVIPPLLCALAIVLLLSGVRRRRTSATTAPATPEPVRPATSDTTTSDTTTSDTTTSENKSDTTTSDTAPAGSLIKEKHHASF